MKYDRGSQPFDPNVLGKVAVLFGGNSVEREISLASGKNVYEALVRSGVECKLIDTAEDVVQQLIAYGADRAFNIAHGTGGEDGTLQGVLEYLNIPYAGSDVMSSALAMDKYRCKLLWQSIGLPTPDFRLVVDEQGLECCEELLPVFVKPSLEGSSVGVTRVERKQELDAAYRKAAEHPGPVLVEEFIK